MDPWEVIPEGLTPICGVPLPCGGGYQAQLYGDRSRNDKDGWTHVIAEIDRMLDEDTRWRRENPVSIYDGPVLRAAVRFPYSYHPGRQDWFAVGECARAALRHGWYLSREALLSQWSEAPTIRFEQRFENCEVLPYHNGVYLWNGPKSPIPMGSTCPDYLLYNLVRDAFRVRGDEHKPVTLHGVTITIVVEDTSGLRAENRANVGD